MASNILVLGVFGIVTIILNGILWGTTGYIFFRLFGGKEDKWFIGAIIVALVFVFWHSIITNRIINKVGFSIEDEEISNFLGDALGSINFFAVIINLVSAVIGFKIGQILVNKTIAKTKTYKVRPSRI